MIRTTKIFLIYYCCLVCIPLSAQECSNIALIDSTQLTYPVVGSPGEETARTLVKNYLDYAICFEMLPEASRFQPYFFETSDLSSKYEIVDYHEGFAKKPASMHVRLDNGLQLLFCFNRMVINCNQVKACECPYDFNWTPQLSAR